jgi:hypothetical protein
MKPVNLPKNQPSTRNDGVRDASYQSLTLAFVHGENQLDSNALGTTLHEHGSVNSRACTEGCCRLRRKGRHKGKSNFAYIDRREIARNSVSRSD